MPANFHREPAIGINLALHGIAAVCGYYAFTDSWSAFAIFVLLYAVALFFEWDHWQSIRVLRLDREERRLRYLLEESESWLQQHNAFSTGEIGEAQLALVANWQRTAKTLRQQLALVKAQRCKVTGVPVHEKPSSSGP